MKNFFYIDFKIFSRLLFWMLVLFALLLKLSAQSVPPVPVGVAPGPAATPTPAPSTEPNVGLHFEAFTDYARFTNGMNATIIGARLPVTPRWSGVYSQYQIPAAKAQLYLIGAEFRDRLSHLLGKEYASKVQFSSDAIEIFARADAGTKRDDLGNNPIFAYGIHGGTDVAVGKVGGGTLALGLRVGFVRVPRQPAGPRNFVLSSTGEIVPGLTLRF